MSHSTETRKRATGAEHLVPLRVTADTPFTEISVYSGAFELLGTGLRTLDLSVKPGIHKVRFRAGATVVDRLITIHHDSEGENVEGPVVEFASAAPLTRTRDYDANRADDALRLTSRPREALGAGSQVAVMVHHTEPLPAKLQAAIQISPGEADPKGADALTLTRLSANAFGCHIEIDPGFYRLTLDPHGSNRVSLALHAIVGWQIQVFIGVRSVSNDALELDLSGIAVFYRPNDTRYNPGEPELRLTELARTMLGDRDSLRTVPSSGFAEQYCETHPMLPLCLAHCHAYLGNYNDELAHLHQRLHRALPSHPDVRILTAQKTLAQWGHAPPYLVPPMLLNSWDMLVDGSYVDPDLVPVDSTSFAVSETFYPCGAWFMWDAGPAPSGSGHTRVTRVDLMKWDVETTFKTLASHLPRSARLDRCDGLEEREQARSELERVARELGLEVTERELLDHALWVLELTSKLSSQELGRRQLSTREEIRKHLIAGFRLPNAVLGTRLIQLHRKLERLHTQES